MNPTLELRRPTADDVPFIEDVAKNYTNNPLPNKFVEAAVVEENNEIVAFGVLRANVEGLLYVSGTDKQKVEAIKLLIEKAKSDAKKNGYEDIYIFAQDKEFANILMKHFGFRVCEGVPLILDL